LNHIVRPAHALAGFIFSTLLTPLLIVTPAEAADKNKGFPEFVKDSGELLYSTEGNRLRRYDVDTIGTGELIEDILVERASVDPDGRDINGEICFLPDGSGRFVAGEDTGQPNPPAGWGVFEADGSQVQKLTATYFVAGSEPHGCEFAPNGTLFTSEVGFQGFGTKNGQLIMWFPGLESYCKLATNLGTAGSVAIDALGRVYVTETSGLSIQRFSPPFPTSDDATGGCGGIDSLGSPVADTVQRETFVAPGNVLQTFSGVAIAPNGNLYAASVLTGAITEYDLDGNVVRSILAPANNLPPIVTGHPQGIAVGSDGTVYYADLDLVGTLPNVRPGPDGRVWRIRFDKDGDPQPPEVVRDRLAFPDGVSIASGNLEATETQVPDWPTHAGGPKRQFFNPNETWLTPETVDDLVEKWRFRTNAVITASPSIAPVEFPDGSTRRVVFALSWDGFLYAVDFETGAEVWRFAWEDQPGASFPAAASVTIADVNGERRVFFAAGEVVYALEPATGAEIWRFYAGTGCRDKTTGQPPGLCGFTGERNQVESTPLVTGNTVYFGMDINDVPTGKGGFYALSAVTGTLAWYFDIETAATCRPDPSDEIRKFDGYHSASQLGLPANFFATRSGCDHDRQVTGCGNVWSSPAHDPTRRLLYFGTSNCDTDSNPNTPAPGPEMPDFDEALVAISTDGVPAWRWRPREIDTKDLAFGAVPNLFTIDINGYPVDVVGIGGKDGTYYTIDRDGYNEITGVSWDDADPIALPYWSTKVVPGGAIGGIIATASVDQNAGRVNFSTAPGLSVFPPQMPTVHSLDIDTGAIVWQNTATTFPGFDASYGPTSGIPGLVIVGSVITPHLRIFDAEEGTLLYDKIIGEPGTASGIASGAAVLDGTLVVGAGIGSRSGGGSSPGDFAANTPSAIIALCVPDSPGCPGPDPVVIPGSIEVPEGDEGTTIESIPLQLSSPSTKRVEVSWEVIDYSPEVAGEIVAASGTAVFEPGQTETNVPVEVLGDYLLEEDELGAVRFHSPVNATIDPENELGFVRILNDDVAIPGC
jgi:outer membrane protein assembly factor BamB